MSITATNPSTPRELNERQRTIFSIGLALGSMAFRHEIHPDDLGPLMAVICDLIKRAADEPDAHPEAAS
jgi:hypothetical protein